MVMSKIQWKAWFSVAIGAAFGTVMFYGIVVAVEAEGSSRDGFPNALQWMGLYAFFFGVMWLSRRPFANSSQDRI